MTHELWLGQGTIDRLLSGRMHPDDAPPGFGSVAALVRALVAPPTPAELAGEAEAMAAASAIVTAQPVGARHPAEVATGRRTRSGHWRVKVSGLVVVGTLVGTSGLAAAGVLPAPVQDVAHRIFSAVGIEVPSASDRPDTVADQRGGMHEEVPPDWAGPPEGTGPPEDAGPPAVIPPVDVDDEAGDGNGDQGNGNGNEGDGNGNGDDDDEGNGSGNGNGNGKGNGNGNGNGNQGNSNSGGNGNVSGSENGNGNGGKGSGKDQKGNENADEGNGNANENSNGNANRNGNGNANGDDEGNGNGNEG
jgi:hypothetical protein